MLTTHGKGAQRSYLLRKEGWPTLEYTLQGNRWDALPQAVAWCRDRGSTLWSLEEAAIFRVEANARDGANSKLFTRTTYLKFKVGGDYWLAFDDVPDTSRTDDARKNLLLERSDAGYAEYARSPADWSLPLNDPDVARTLRRAERAGRIVPASGTELKLSLESVDGGKTAFDQNDIVRAAMPRTAKEYGAWLHAHKWRTSALYGVAASDFEQDGVDERTTQVGCVALDGMGSDQKIIFPDIIIGPSCRNVGFHFRGIRHEK